MLEALTNGCPRQVISCSTEPPNQCLTHTDYSASVPALVGSILGDEAPVKDVIDWLGDDRLVLSTDFPHGDSKVSKAVESLLTLTIIEESKRKILWDNCAAYYGLLTSRSDGLGYAQKPRSPLRPDERRTSWLEAIVSSMRTDMC